jgi:hypothetical protein
MAKLGVCLVELMLTPHGSIICFLDFLGSGDTALKRDARVATIGAPPTAKRLLIGAVGRSDRDGRAGGEQDMPGDVRRRRGDLQARSF